MFESSFTALKDYLARGFIVGAFLPVLIVIAVNLFFVALATKGLEGSIGYLKDSLELADVATAIGLLTLLALPLAFTFSPLLTPFRVFLEGEWLPQCVREDFRRAVRARAKGATTRADEAQEYVDAFIKLENAANALTGVLVQRQKDPKVEDVALIPTAVEAVALCEQKLKDLREATPENYVSRSGELRFAFNAANVALSAALEKNAIDHIPKTVTGTDLQACNDLKAAYDAFVVWVTDAHEDARLEASRRKGVVARHLLAKDVRPTRLGNVRAQFEDYTMNAYGVSFDYLWPRLRMGIEGAEDKFEPVEQAETQLAFALMILLSTLLSSAGWLAYLALGTMLVVPMIIAAVAIPILNWTFYQSVVESQAALLQVSKAAIDRTRLPLMTALRAPVPASYTEELERWQSLEALSRGELKGQDFDYASPPDDAGTLGNAGGAAAGAAATTGAAAPAPAPAPASLPAPAPATGGGAAANATTPATPGQP